jgi:riboflavin kinase/FMN adenylyltransferase
MNFTAPIITGTGKGKEIGFPTFNLEMSHVPSIEEGVFACFARLGKDDIRLPAVMHYGARPTLNAEPSCEVHILDYIGAVAPQAITVEVADKLRDVQNFGSVENLSQQLQKDVKAARVLLCKTC